MTDDILDRLEVLAREAVAAGDAYSAAGIPVPYTIQSRVIDARRSLAGAADPATVLALIARVRQAEAEPKERCEAETPINDPYGSDPTFWLRCVHDEGHDGPHHADDGDHERDWDDEWPESGGTLAFRDPAGLMRAEGLKRVRLEGGERIWAHRRRDCIGSPCPIHYRTDHHMRGWRQHWRADRSLMERICPHGIGHPDPDQRLTDGGVHGCDGCCRTKEEAGR